jgi:NAD(P)-dependent dehydrogenase (short-subunit alcohol dehydrogenase family)
MATPSTKRVALVTGATDGIGRQTALELARLGFAVIVHGRSAEKAAAAAADIRAAVPGAVVDAEAFDLASLAAVRAGAERLAARPALHVLINNAGIFAHDRSLTADGLESTMAVNHFAPFLLTARLLGLLERSGPARVVNVSSVAHQRGELDLDDLSFAHHFSGYGAYAASKLANVLHAAELAKRVDPRRVTTYSLHPGVISTKLLKSGFGARGESLERGAQTSVFCATDPGLAEVSGRYYDDRREARPAPAARDDQLRVGLWRESERLIDR